MLQLFEYPLETLGAAFDSYHFDEIDLLPSTAGTGTKRCYSAGGLRTRRSVVNGDLFPLSSHSIYLHCLKTLFFSNAKSQSMASTITSVHTSVLPVLAGKKRIRSPEFYSTANSFPTTSFLKKLRAANL